MSAFNTESQARRAAMRGGFTLMELAAVIVIAAVLAVVAAPTLSALSQTRAAVAARQLLRDLTFTRQHAMATGTRCWVVLDPATDTWSVLSENPSSPGLVGATIMNDAATGQPFVQTLNSGQYVGVGIESVDFDGDATIGFDWRGEPLNGTQMPLASTGSVTLTGNHVVTVQAGTGFASYNEP